MRNLLIFGGTSETRALLCALEPMKLGITLSVATDYGRSLAPADYPGLTVRTGRLGPKQMQALIREKDISCVIDATHPYAAEATKSISAAAAAEGIPCLRFLREKSFYGGAVIVSSALDAAAHLSGTTGNVLLTTGSKELEAFTRVRDYRTRLYVRVLPTPESVDACLAFGYQVAHIIAMQGPFSKELNIALMRQLNIKTLVTKDGGVLGGFPEKLEAAEDLNAELVIIGRSPENGLTLQDIAARVSALLEEHG
jgi:precorrin-6x reductase